MTARKYNPGFLSDNELVASFCVRTQEFASMVDTLRECSGNANTHQIVIGPRGSGKTSLLLRVASEMRRDTELASRFSPVVFAEESYRVSTAGEFWLECLSRLADQAPRSEDGPDLRRSFEELRDVRDDRLLGDRCLGILQDFADRERRRLVLVVENLNMMFRDMADDEAGWRLRHVLQTEPRIVLLASATSRFEDIDDPDKALYELFRVLALRPLDSDDCATLWRNIAGQPRAPQTIQALRILTGGSPRLLTIVARFGARLSFHELMTDLLDLVDDHTEYFKSHLDALPAQERRVYLALADLWKPATARDIADRARLDTSKCSAHLARLTDRGAVEVAGGTARRKLYYLAERLYNIYYLMRQARGPAPLIKALIGFMEGYYSTDELKELGTRIARETLEIDDKVRSFNRTAFEQLVQLPSLAAHRDELLSLTAATSAFAGQDSDTSAPTTPASCVKELLENGHSLAKSGRLQEALAQWEALVRRFGGSDAPDDRNQVLQALVNMGTALKHLDRAEEALAVWDEVTRRFGGDRGPAIPHAVATALINTAFLHAEANRPLEALIACDEVLQRFGETRIESLQGPLAHALIGKGVSLMAVSRPNEALAAFDEFLERFSASEAHALIAEIARAMAGRGSALLGLGRLDEAVAAWSRLADRFGNSEAPDVIDHVAMALGNKASALSGLGRPEEALAACEEVLRLYPDDDRVSRRGLIAAALLNKGTALVLLRRPAEAIAAWGECAERFGSGSNEQMPVVTALMNQSTALVRAERPEEALAVWGEVADRFETSTRADVLALVAKASTLTGTLLERLGRREEAVAAWNEVERRFGTRGEPPFVELVTGSFVNKGTTLVELGRPEEALTAFDRAVGRAGASSEPGMIHTVANALLNKGTVLSTLNRAEEALGAWNELIGRYGASDEPAILKLVAGALVGKSAVLAGMDRMEEALAACDALLHRFATDTSSTYVEEVSVALSNKISILAFLDRPEEALAVGAEAVRRFRTTGHPAPPEMLAGFLVRNADLLTRLNRIREAVAAWNEIVQRFGNSEAPPLRHAADMARLGLAEHELAQGAAKAAIENANLVLQQDAEIPDSRWRAHLLRARACLSEGNEAACARDVEMGLSILPILDVLPKEALDVLSELAVDLGSARMRDLIRESPASDLLLPFTTAFERELGLEPQVAREVEEVAEDIRQDIEDRRRRRGNR